MPPPLPAMLYSTLDASTSTLSPLPSKPALNPPPAPLKALPCRTLLRVIVLVRMRVALVVRTPPPAKITAGAAAACKRFSVTLLLTMNSVPLAITPAPCTLSTLPVAKTRLPCTVLLLMVSGAAP